MVNTFDGKAADAKAQGKAFDETLGSTLKTAGYPAKADPSQINWPMSVVILTIMMIYVTMVYGPIAAMLVEMFPTRIRYTSMSLPYHIGNGWFGGFLPATAFAIVAAKGNIYSGLWYPIVVALITLRDRHAVRQGDQGLGYLREGLRRWVRADRRLTATMKMLGGGG